MTAQAAMPAETPAPATGAPSLSVIVALVSDTTAPTYNLSHLEGCLEALADQINPPPMEVIVPYPAGTPGISHLSERFSSVVFLEVDNLRTYPRSGLGREHHDELRARGLQVARGDILALLEDHARPDRDWCQQIVQAHQADYAAVGGAMENGIDRPLNWAVYFCDFGRYQNPLPKGESAFASDANISYKREALEAIRPVWEASFHETEVNGHLLALGEKIALSPELIVSQHRSDLDFASALQERFVWGRSYAATRSRDPAGGARLLRILLAPLLPLVLLGRQARDVFRTGRHIGPFVKALPWTVALLISWSLGELSGYLSRKAG